MKLFYCTGTDGDADYLLLRTSLGYARLEITALGEKDRTALGDAKARDDYAALCGALGGIKPSCYGPLWQQAPGITSGSSVAALAVAEVEA